MLIALLNRIKVSIFGLFLTLPSKAQKLNFNDTIIEKKSFLINVTGGTAFTSSGSIFLTELNPNYNLKINKRIVAYLETSLIYLRLRNSNVNVNNIHNELGIGALIFPLKKKFLFTKIGYSYGNYFIDKSGNSVKIFGSSYIYGVGVKAKLKKCYFAFTAQIDNPFSKMYVSDFVRMIGIGFRL